MTTPTITIPSTNDTARAAMLNAAEGLGALVWWSLTDTRVTPDRMRSILTAEGADASIVPDIEQTSAIKRATREWSQGRGKADRFRAEVAQANGPTLTIGILRREQVASNEVRWVQVDACEFDATTGTWNAIGASPEARAFVGHADEIRNHLDHQWIRPSVLIRGLVDAQAVCLRDRGGVYYVPARHQDDLARLGRIVAAIGRCHLDIVHAQATPESRASIGAGATAAIRGDLGDLLTRINGWSESARKVSDDSAATVLTDLASLKAKADLYADALQISMDDLAASIAVAKAEAERILTGSAVAEKPAKPAPDALVENLRKAASEGEAQADGSILVDADTLQRNGLKCNRDRVGGQHGYWTNGLGGRVAAALGYSARLRGPSADAPMQLRPKAFTAPTVEGSSATQDAPEAVGTDSGSVDASVALVDGVEQPWTGGAAFLTEDLRIVAASEVEETVVVLDADADEAQADVREALALKTPAELRRMFEQVVGSVPGKLSKAQMIDRIASAAV